MSVPRLATGRRVHVSLPWSDPASAAEYLAGLSGYENSGVIAEPGTRRIEAITSALGAPNRRFPAVHITGTNGKGSTSAMTTRLLRSQGLRVGTYTSPHLAEVTERIAIDGSPIAAEQFAESLGAVAWAARRIGVTPSWFEAVTATAFRVFADAAVEVAVVEVGMLGRWDATNIINSTVAAITNVELDHTEYAGPSRVHIAMEKAGIVHRGATLVLGDTDPDLMTIFGAQRPRRLLQLGVDFEATHRRPSPVGSTVDLTTPWGEHRAVPVNLLGAHQCRNAAVALAAAQSFLDSPIDGAAVRNSLGGVRIAGRAEVLRGAEPIIIVDGAHNRAAARTLRDTVDEYFPRARHRVLVCAATGIRDPEEFFSGIGVRDFELVVATEVRAPKTVPAEAVAAAARRCGVAAMSEPDVDRAVRSAVTAAGVGGMVLTAGSLYLVAPARAAVTAVAADEPGCDSA